VTEGGYAKRTAVEEYRLQGRGGLGIKVAKLAEERGDLVGALVVQEEDEVLVVMGGGKVVRSSVAGVPAKGRDTMGVIFAKPDKNDRIIEVARNTERGLEAEVEASAERESEADHADEPSASEILAIAADDVTLAEDAGPDEESAEAALELADEAEGTSGDAEANEDNTGGNE